ncbi:MAG: glycerol-3-phosphate dehydrogenase/oxidase [Gaiellales bacterium]
MTLDRAGSLEALATRRFDVLVVGGGIVGAGVAAHAARLGLSVALVDAGDFGGATSSASSKLIHGGLRYLRMGDVRLVREAHHERRVLTNVVAPHLVHRLPFLFPLYEGGPYRPAFVQSGILLYSALAMSRLNWLVKPAKARAAVPQLRGEGLRSCALYADAWTNDARLCLENVRAAAAAGAIVANYARVTELRVTDGRATGAEVAADGATIPIDAHCVVNAAGPWVDHIRRLEDPAARPSVRLSKGVHAIVPLPARWPAALTIAQDEVRVTFAVPWYGMLLLGTTDTAYDGDPVDVRADPEDVETILHEASLALDLDTLTPEAVLSTYAGLRVLPAGEGESVNARRETVYSVGPAGVVSVAGGKLTTYRRIAIGALERLRAELGIHRFETEPFPLPGAAAFDALRLPLPLEPELARHLYHHHGALTADVLAPALERPELLEPLHPSGPDIAAQAVYAGRCEWATTADDVVRRRTTLGYRGLADEVTVARVADLLAE